MNLEGTWAVKCHGWMKLSDDQFAAIDKMADLSSCTRWVIAKDYISTPTDPSDIDKILDNFRIPFKARMIPGDIRPPNYKGEYFVDLGNTITFPHPEWSTRRYNWCYEKAVNCVKYWEYRNGTFQD